MTAPPGHLDPGPGWQRRYWAIFGGQALSLTGSALTQFVLLWWITDTTGSVSALATAGMAALLPQALLGPLGGTFADRYSRRLLMIGADVISALCMLVLIFLFATGRVELWHVYTMMFIRSSMQAFQAPAAAASTAMLVPADFLPRAAGLNQTLQGVMTVAAAPLGALAISVLPLGAALGIDVATALLGILPLLLFHIPQLRLSREERAGVWAEFREGVRLVWRHPGLRRLYLLLGAVVLTVMPTFTLTPLLVKLHFGGGPGQVALMEGLAGVGMIVGGLAVAVLAPRRRVVTVLVALALSCLTVALTALAPGDAFWLAVVWWVVSGVTFAFGNAPMTAVLQTVIPNQLQGRALSLLSTVMGLAGPAGLALAGPLGEWAGVRGVFVVGGVLSALACLAGFLSPALLRLDRVPLEAPGPRRHARKAEEPPEWGRAPLHYPPPMTRAPSPPLPLATELEVAAALVRQAGALLGTHLARGLTVEHKTGADDPVTAADREASDLILAGLRSAFPGDGLLSEEAADDPARLEQRRVWIVDPIDGTKEFTSGSPDYAVSIGLAVDGEPMLGAVYAPATDELFAGAVGLGVTRNGKPTGFGNRADYVISVSDTEFRRELHAHDLPGMAPSGSIALKLARIANGEADVTFSMSPRSEWDVAGGHALLRALGGDLRRRDGRPIRYNSARPHLEQGIIGGRLDALAWLESELAGRGLPTAHLGLTPEDPAWATLAPGDQAALRGHSGVCVRHGGGRTLALIVVGPGGVIERAEGDAFHLDRLSRDVTRGLGTLSAAVPVPEGGPR